MERIDGRTVSEWVTRQRSGGSTDLCSVPSSPVVAVSICGDDGVVVVVGAVDRFAVPVLGSRLQEALDAGAVTVIVDVAQLDFIDSAGLRLLAAWTQRFRSQGGDLVLASPRPGLVHLLDLLDLRAALTLHDC